MAPTTDAAATSTTPARIIHRADRLTRDPRPDARGTSRAGGERIGLDPGVQQVAL